MGSAAVLVANRGEIAVRVLRAAADLGLRAVAVHEPGDDAHVRRADEVVALPAGGYLDAAELVAAARRSGCGYLHPGYGFLSESAELARRCGEAGIVFVGPSPQALELFGDKARARALAVGAGVPVLPGTDGAATLEQARALLADGPVMVKAVGGGGGRGMRVVRTVEELPDAWERCRSEARQGFGRDELYAERLWEGARHIEVQIVADGAGAVGHLWERDCSAQRRHQKLVEIAPAPALDPALRDRLLDAALGLARAARYQGLGTVEFLVQGEEFVFMEANPRLQVEHTVTEEVTGVDLVAAQLRIAAGDTLAALGLDVPPPVRGFAVQVRVNAEVAEADGSVRASAGRITRYDVPTGPGIRVDTAARTGTEIGARYDSLLAKVVAHAPRGGFEAACARAGRALDEFVVEGVRTSIPVLANLLEHPGFTAGGVDTGFVQRHLPELVPAGPPPDTGVAEPGTTTAPMSGTVTSIEVEPGQLVTDGTVLLVLEAMKMEHVVRAERSGVVRAVRAEVGDTVTEGAELVLLDVTEDGPGQREAAADLDPDAIRPDLAQARARHAFGLDENRPEAVAKRHATGRRTARENIEELCDPGSFTEFGALAVAAQRQRRPLEELIRTTPADGMVTGTARIGGTAAVVMSYDYTVLAGTQGHNNHRKTDRMLQIAEERGLPVVLFAEGGGGRPGDTDTTVVAGLNVPTFQRMARLSGRVPLIGIASGRCFAGNAALLGCCDVVIATPEANIGMGGPAMIEGGGLGVYRPEEIGPLSVQVPNGVVDLPVADEAEAVRAARAYLSYVQGAQVDWEAPDQRMLRHAVPENRRRAYDIRAAIDGLADTGSVLELRRGFGAGIITALVRVEGRPLGLIANNPAHLGGAIDRDAADKAARFLRQCEASGLPVLSLCDTPGFMVGPDAERTATVRQFADLFVAGARLTVPLVCLVLRKAYGLGAMAMMGGSTQAPVATAAWPSGEFGGMGLEGAVRLGYRRELAAIADPAERERAFEARVAELYEHGRAVNAAAALEIDTVIDPERSRSWLLSALDT
ncbi:MULTISPECIES: carboxyl transferase domain-containing protein [unclassified Streptomyces]|uniref:acetyl-CoA carboxylase family protein n=1 Tax=unclassified Streptomyces TaxID=2593676 RepID=UPI000DBA29DB|nr:MULTISPECIES: carboxyl transferase domain-containing protein [unclassified Streptomyces]MYT75498.1 ATP-grasp domain-containing protein [Streptomyces sp. SID8367]RAJ86903.1 biotin-dependent enzyme [Streptomyces sp. PsTaAH-137]